jgi:hydrogenase expression/formation protein HypC
MCLGVPGKLVDVWQDEGLRMGRVEFGGVTKRVCLEYVPEAECGDFVLVHVGFALTRLDEADAARTFELLAELGELEQFHEVES